jgi:hypothetical protein
MGHWWFDSTTIAGIVVQRTGRGDRLILCVDIGNGDEWRWWRASASRIAR